MPSVSVSHLIVKVHVHMASCGGTVVIREENVDEEKCRLQLTGLNAGKSGMLSKLKYEPSSVTS